MTRSRWVDAAVTGAVALVTALACTACGPGSASTALSAVTSTTGGTGATSTPAPSRSTKPAPTVPSATRAASVTRAATKAATKAPAALPTRTPTVAPAAPAPVRHTVASPAPRPAPLPKPPAPAPPAPAPAANLCGAPANPYGYNYCGRGSHLQPPAADVCSYFSCIGNFWNGKGYMEECADTMVSMSGGRRGACSYHGGELRPVTG